MFSKPQLMRIKPLIVFFAAYTIGFCLFIITLKYTFPFLAGFLLALAAQPVITWMKKRLRIPPTPAAALATLFIYIILFGLLFLAGYWLICEISQLTAKISSLSKEQLGVMAAPVNKLISQIGDYLKNIDSDFIQQNQEKMLNIAQTGISVAGKVLSGVLRFLTSLPAIFTMFIVMIFSTYFFSKDMASIKHFALRMFPNHSASSIRNFSIKGKNMSGRYICSYLFIYFITFVETLIVFLALGVPYPLVLSIITGFADIMPVLGPGTIYIPLSIIYLVQGNFFNAGALIICWLLITAIRQVIEPKIISSSINIHPLTMLAAIYFALVAGNFWILIYFSVLIILYKILTQTGTLPTLFEHSAETAEPETLKNKK